MSVALKLEAPSIKVGSFAEATRVFTEPQVSLYAELSKDINPVHLDAAFAASTPFGQRIVHGMFVSAMFSALLANELPGPGTIYLGQELSFKKPVFFREEVCARVEVVEMTPHKRGGFVYKLRTTVTKKNGELAVDGHATVLRST